jgi:tetratricopeptide (TPR) repeat protein
MAGEATAMTHTIRSIPTLAAIAAVALAACTTIEKPESAAPTPKVKIEGGHEVAQSASADSQPFITAAHAALERGSPRALERLAALYPDQALFVLRTGEAPDLADALEQAYDQAVGSDGAPGAREAIESLRAAGLARLADRDLTQARSQLATAAATARFHHQTDLALDCGLLLAQAERESGDLAPARDAWQEAVTAGAASVDPTLWRRALDERPAQATFPGGDGALQLRIADLEWSRGELEAAFLDYRKARASLTSAGDLARARLGEANALHALGRRGEALVAIGDLQGNSDPEVAGRALALAGVIAAEQDDLERARTLLARANGASWPGQDRALSDLGVVCLRLGKKEAGLDALRRSADALAETGDFAGRARALQNLAAYLRHDGQKEEADRLEQEAHALVLEQGLLGF